MVDIEANGQTTTTVDDSSSASDDDSETRERMRAFSAAGNAAAATANKPETGSVHRYDEYASFLTRSQRAHALGKEKPLSKEEEDKRKVHFRTVGDSDDVLERIHELPPLTDEDKQHCYMTAENWDSIDTDIELTRKRWENHVTGRLPFDNKNNSMRGLEVMLDPASANHGLMKKHETSVISESNRQKRENEWIHWGKFRQVSLENSSDESERVRNLAQRDAEEAIQCWEADEKRTRLSTCTAKKDKKRPSLWKKLFAVTKASKNKK